MNKEKIEQLNKWQQDIFYILWHEFSGGYGYEVRMAACKKIIEIVERERKAAVREYDYAIGAKQMASVMSKKVLASDWVSIRKSALAKFGITEE